MCRFEPNKGVDMIGYSTKLEGHASQSTDGAAQVFVEAWAPIWLDKGAAFFGGADPVVMQAVIGGTHVRRVPVQFCGATPILSKLGSDEFGTPAGLLALERRIPVVVRGKENDHRLPSGNPAGWPPPVSSADNV